MAVLSAVAPELRAGCWSAHHRWALRVAHIWRQGVLV